MVSFLLYSAVRCKCPVCTVVRWIVFIVVNVLCLFLYCGHLMCICVFHKCTFCFDCIDVLLWMSDCWLAVSIRKVLRPAT
jgi:hypothetical protein